MIGRLEEFQQVSRPNAEEKQCGGGPGLRVGNDDQYGKAGCMR